LNKAALDSYLRNLAGQIIGAVMIVIQTSGIASPIDFGLGEWLLVANALWASIIPTAIRWLNKKDPAFGVIAEVVAKEVSKKLASEATKAKKPVAKKPATKSATKATGTKKATTKK
jgi:type IV secretory pathway TrbD component